MPQITDPALLQALNGGGQATSPMQAPIRAPARVLREADPYKQSAEARANADQAMQAKKFQLDQTKFQADQQRQQQQDALGTESERTAGFLAGRISDAVKRLTPAAQKDPSALAPSVGVEMLRGTLGDTAANMFTGSERQQIRAAQLDILDAALTLGTGAAYTKEQLANYAESYLPQIGDAPGTVTSKRQALRTLLQEAARKAGRSAPDIEAAIKALDSLPDIGAGGNKSFEQAKQESIAAWGQEVYDRNGNPLPPDGGDGEGYDSSGKFIGMFGEVVGKNDPASPTPTAKSGPDYVAAGVGDLIQGGVDNTIGLAVNPVGQALYNAIPGNQGTYDIGKSIRDALGLPQGDPTYSAVIQSAAGGFGAAGLARGLSNVATGAGRNALAQFGAAPLSDLAIGAGAGAGGEAASRYGPVPQAAGSVAGGVAANALLGLATRGRVRSGGGPPDLNREVVAAGERQNIPVRLPDAAPSTRNQMAAAEASPYSGPLIKRSMEADNAAIADRVRGLGGEGVPQTQDYTLGQRVQGVGTRYIDTTKKTKDRLYARAEKLAGGATVTPRNADAVLDQNIQELRAAGENSNAAAIKYLEGLRNDIDRGLSITAVQNIRTNMRGQISERGLTATDTERRVMQVIDAMNLDLADQLPNGAASALKAADKFYRERQTFIKDVLQPFMGQRGKQMNPEATARAFRGMVGSRANFDKLKSFIDQADPQEVDDFRATIAESLVTGPRGEIGAAAMASNIEKVPENIRRLVFGEDGAKALRDIQILARAKGDSRSGLNNSKSGVVMAAKQIGLRSLMSGVFGAATGGAAGAVIAPVATEAAAALGQARTARLLLNPDFTRMLRNAPETTKPEVINAYFQRMRNAAAKSPVYANDVQAMETAIIDALGKSPVRAAAAPSGQQEQNTGRVPPQ